MIVEFSKMHMFLTMSYKIISTLLYRLFMEKLVLNRNKMLAINICNTGTYGKSFNNYGATYHLVRI